ncbi:MAG TPA: argininosuccinate lyase [Gammaproteobacteria bacterium]|nr:argininosuccinate lyase [Gammaproteobacteria bacterium]
MQQKLWGGRFTTPTSLGAESFLASIHFDCELASDDILGSMAHAAMLAHCGIITAEENSQIQHGLHTIFEKIAAGNAEFNIRDEDIHMNIERMLNHLIGETAGKLHTARSRNDQVATDTHLYLRRHIIAITDLLTKLNATLLHQAEQHQNVILPGYTHLQRAQPILLPLHFLAYSAMFARDCARLKDSWSRVNQSPLGAAALAGTRFPTDPHYTAQSLGFDGVYANSLDAVSDRDFVVEFLAAASLIMAHISRLSEELILWSSQEFNFIRLDDAWCTGSSIMPQKKNPDIPELARGKTGRVYGALLNVLTLLKGLPLAYNKDLQEDKEPLFDTVKTLRDILAIFSPLLATLTVNTTQMRTAVDAGFLNATDLADYLAQTGLPFRTTHHIAGKMVAYCTEKKCRLEDLSLQEMQQFAPQITADVYKILDIENIVATREKLATNKHNAVTQQLALFKTIISHDQKWVSDKQALLDKVHKKFDLPVPHQNLLIEKI